MKKIAHFFIAAVALFLVGGNALGQNVTADLVIINANIRTMDAKRTVARSIAVINGKIVAIGPMPMMRAMASDGFAKETSVSPGEASLSVSIDVVFELGR